MFNDVFKAKYTTIPFATASRCHQGGSLSQNIETLSHMHREIELLLVLKGEAVYYIDTVRHPLREGDLVLVAPYLLHRATILAKADFHHICLCFDVSLLQDATLRQLLEGGCCLLPPIIHRADAYAPYVRAAYDANAGQRPGWELTVIGNLSLLFGLLKERGQITPGSSTGQRSICYRIVDYIALHYQEDLTSTALAAMLHMNGSYFCRLFRRHFGYTFLEYLCTYRIERSKHLLRSTDLSVSEIASRVGFNSLSYYGKRFRDETGETPKEYRKRHR